MRLYAMNYPNLLSCFDGITSPDLKNITVGFFSGYEMQQHPKLTAKSIEGLRRFDKLRGLNLGMAALSETHLQAIGKLTKLEELSLLMCKGVEGHIDRLVPLTRLRLLDLAGVKLGEEDIASLVKLTSLKKK